MVTPKNAWFEGRLMDIYFFQNHNKTVMGISVRNKEVRKHNYTLDSERDCCTIIYCILEVRNICKKQM